MRFTPRLSRGTQGRYDQFLSTTSRVMRKTTPEVIIRLSSGLGNQLFQLAQGMALAEKTEARLRLDTTWFQLVSGIHPVKRHLRIPQFKVTLTEAFSGPRRLVVGMLAALFDKTQRGQLLLSVLGRMQVIQEIPGGHRKNCEATESRRMRVYLNGYWQTSGPFLQIRDSLLPMLEPRNPISADAETLIAKATCDNTGFIHVRRGDYVSFMGEDGLLPASYYSRALLKMRDIGKEVGHWMIFAEDLDWARANLSFVPNSEIVHYRSASRDIEDLMIMKACSAGIVANSSYSWWGAALGDRPNQPVVAPDRYWNQPDSSLSDWLLPNWDQVQAWI